MNSRVNSVKRLALLSTMQGAGRYLECLEFWTRTWKADLPKEFVDEVEKDFVEYAQKMTEAQLPFKKIEAIGELP